MGFEKHVLKHNLSVLGIACALEADLIQPNHAQKIRHFFPHGIGGPSCVQNQSERILNSLLTLLLSSRIGLFRQIEASSDMQGLKRGSWQEVQYKGEWMRRPLSSSEIGWLVRILLLVSDLANRSLGLDQPPPASEGPVSLDLKARLLPTLRPTLCC